ncbi:MAG: hypothetical protein WAW41_02020 [Methylobacter sp.]
MTTNPLATQIGGSHFQNMAIEPYEYIHQNNLGFLAGCIIERLCRFDQPTGKGLDDLREISRELDILIDQNQKGFIENRQKIHTCVGAFCDANGLSDDKRVMIELVAYYRLNNGVADLYQAKDLCRDILERHHVQHPFK